jgi:hypothetical protein
MKVISMTSTGARAAIAKTRRAMSDGRAELGATVADAKRLARKASLVFVHFLSGPED